MQLWLWLCLLADDAYGSGEDKDEDGADNDGDGAD